MKRLFLVLSVIVLATAMSYAGQIATVNGLQGDVIIKHNGAYTWATIGATIYDSVTIYLRTNAAITLNTCNIAYTNVYPDGKFWSFRSQSLQQLGGKEDAGAIIMPGPDPFFCLCYGKLVNGDIVSHPPIANAQGYIVENPTRCCTTDASGNFIIGGTLNPGTYHVQFDGWTGPVQFTHGVIGANIGTLVGHAQ
jgi:hypothetical protein